MNRTSRYRSTDLGFLCCILSSLFGCGTVDDSAGMETDIRVAINEVVPKNKDSAKDSSGNSPDWVELYNYSARTVNLRGYYLSDDRDEPLTYKLANDTIIEGNSYLLLWADGIGTEHQHLPLGLSGDGESFLLSSPDGRLIDAIDFPMAEDDQAFGRSPDGTGQFTSCSLATPGQTNGSNCTSSAP
jgi:hypothetical protein